MNKKDIEMKLREGLGELFKQWHVNEVEMAMQKLTTFSEETIINSYIKKIKRTRKG